MNIPNWNYPLGLLEQDWAKQMAELEASLKPPPAPEETPVRKLGVLLVHGIGDQGRGNTLTRFGEPLFRCAQRWLQHRSGGADLERVELREASSDQHAPSHAKVRLWHERAPTPNPSRFAATGASNSALAAYRSLAQLAERGWASSTPTDSAAGASSDSDDDPAVGASSSEDLPRDSRVVPEDPASSSEEADDSRASEEAPDEPKCREAEWVLAESNWASVFERPSFRSVAFWSVTVVPWMISTQFVDQLSTVLRERQVARALFSFGYLVLTFPLALLIQLLVLLLVPLAMIPPLRPIVGPIQRWISGVIGDTFVLLTSRFQFQSMVTKVRDDIEWLVNEQQCDVVAVLAHSQGAAVAHEAVRQAKEPKVERLITFGSAVARLKALGYVMEHARPMLTASTLITLSVALLAGMYVWNLLQLGGSFLSLLVGVWGLAVLLAVTAYLMPFTLKGINELCHRVQNFELPKATQWEDYYSTADPVSNGKMLVSGLYTSRSVEVHNGANVLSDHSTYWKNLDQFGSRVAGTLLALTGGPFQQIARSPYASDKRERRIRYRIAGRLMVLAAAGLALFKHPRLPEHVQIGAFLQVPLSWAAMLINWLLSLIADAIQLVGSTLNITLIENGVPLPIVPLPVERLSWPVLCVLVALVWYLINLALLEWWHRSDTEDHYRSRWTWKSGRPKKAWWVGFAVLAIPWIGFWGWWLVADPSELWSQVGGRLDPVSDKIGPLIYVVIWQIIESVLNRQKAEESTFGLETTYREFDAPPRSTVGSLFGDLTDSLIERLSRIFERLSEPEVLANLVAAAALLTAVASITVVLLLPSVPDTFQWALALGLLALALGVYGWVQAKRRPAVLVAAVGIFVGVALMPATIAAVGAFSLLQKLTLVVAGTVGATLGFSGAYFLKSGWEAIRVAKANAEA